MSFEHHLHWTRLGTGGSATWQLRLARVREDTRYRGAVALSWFHANLRLLVSGRFRWHFVGEKPLMKDMHIGGGPQRIVEEAFTARMASYSLVGAAERLRWHNVRLTPGVVCHRCPPSVSARIEKRLKDLGVFSVQESITATNLELLYSAEERFDLRYPT